MTYSREFLNNLLVDVYDYSTENASTAVEQIMQLSEDGKSMLNHLVETRQLPDFNYRGLTPAFMKSAKPELSDIDVILCLDGLKRYIAENIK